MARHVSAAFRCRQISELRLESSPSHLVKRRHIIKVDGQNKSLIFFFFSDLRSRKFGSLSAPSDRPLLNTHAKAIAESVWSPEFTERVPRTFIFHPRTPRDIDRRRLQR